MNSHPVSAAPLSPSPPCISTGYTIDDISIAPQHLQDITNHTEDRGNHNIPTHSHSGTPPPNNRTQLFPDDFGTNSMEDTEGEYSNKEICLISSDGKRFNLSHDAGEYDDGTNVISSLLRCHSSHFHVFTNQPNCLNLYAMPQILVMILIMRSLTYSSLGWGRLYLPGWSNI